MRKIKISKIKVIYAIRKMIIVIVWLLYLIIIIPKVTKMVNILDVEKLQISNDYENLNIINSKRDLIEQYYMMSQSYLELFGEYSSDENQSNSSSVSDDIGIDEIKDQIDKINNITVDMKEEIDSLNNVVKHNNYENIVASLITGIFSIIVPIISLLYQFLYSKQSTYPQNIIIESPFDNVYMELNKISHRNKFINEDTILLINENRYEVIKLEKKSK